MEPQDWFEIEDEAALQAIVDRETCPDGLSSRDLGIKPSRGWRPKKDEEDDNGSAPDKRLGQVRSGPVLQHVVMPIAYHLATIRLHEQRRDPLIDEAVCSYEANGGEWESHLCRIARGDRWQQRHLKDCHCAVEPEPIDHWNWSSVVKPELRAELLCEALVLARQGESKQSLTATDGFWSTYGGADWERAEALEAYERGELRATGT